MTQEYKNKGKASFYFGAILFYIGMFTMIIGAAFALTKEEFHEFNTYIQEMYKRMNESI